jgi:shikimate dehydrogenase
MVGANVTVPYKEAVAAALGAEALTPEAGLIGAVNVLGFKDGSLIGHNTDGTGLLQALKQEAQFTVKGKPVLILGAGGAARAVALTLARHGAQRIGIANRTRQRAEELAQTIKQKTDAEAYGLPLEAAELAPWLGTADLVVQASSVGLHPDEETETLPWFDPSSLSPGALVCDLIYNPSPTRFLALASARGCRTMDGLGMLLYQGTQAYTWWTGREAPIAVMRQALLDARATLEKS